MFRLKKEKLKKIFTPAQFRKRLGYLAGTFTKKRALLALFVLAAILAASFLVFRHFKNPRINYNIAKKDQETISTGTSTRTSKWVFSIETTPMK